MGAAGWGAKNIGEPAAAAKALTHARRLLACDPIAQARLCHRHAEVAERTAFTDRSGALVEAGDSDASMLSMGHDAGSLASAYAVLSGRHPQWPGAMGAGHLVLSRRRSSEAESVGELSALAHACYALDYALVESGRPDEATYSSRALEIYEQLGDPEHEFLVLNNLGGITYWADRWDDAVELYRRAASCAERAGRPADGAIFDRKI